MGAVVVACRRPFIRPLAAAFGAAIEVEEPGHGPFLSSTLAAGAVLPRPGNSSGRWRITVLLGRLCVLAVDLANDDLGIGGQGLQHEVEPLAILVGECRSDIEPVIILALSPDH